MLRAVTLLTLDVGSVLYNPAQMPDEIVLKHTDGELVKAKRSNSGDWQSLRREELDVNFWEDGEYSSPALAVATLADRQAFGFRLNGESMNPLTISGTKEVLRTLEIEGLHRGGIRIEDELQLPFAVFTTDEVYYRIYITRDEDDHAGTGREFSVLERREGPHGEWEELAQSESTEPGRLVNEIAEETNMEAVSGSTEDMEGLIHDQLELFKGSYTEADEDLRDAMAIQNNTAFDPSTPKPRPIDFPIE